MDINRISLYLGGKLPPYYRAPFDKLELIELVRANSVVGYSDDFFKLIDSQDFYSMCLNRVDRADPDSLVQILSLLGIPEDGGGLNKIDTKKRDLEMLKVEFEEMENMGIQDSQKRGYLFEKWICRLFDLFDLQPRGSYRTDYDQIDGSFVLDGKEYLLEAKWTSDSTATDVSDRLFGRLDRCLIGTVGLLISINGFTTNLCTTSAQHKNIILLSGKNLKQVLNSEIDLNTFLVKIGFTGKIRDNQVAS